MNFQQTNINNPFMTRKQKLSKAFTKSKPEVFSGPFDLIKELTELKQVARSMQRQYFLYDYDYIGALRLTVFLLFNVIKDNFRGKQRLHEIPRFGITVADNFTARYNYIISEIIDHKFSDEQEALKIVSEIVDEFSEFENSYEKPSFFSKFFF